MSKKIILGLVEEVYLETKKGLKKFSARIDTGASRSSIDKDLVEEFGLGPIIKEMIIRSAEGKSKRPVMKVNIVLSDTKFSEEFTIANRTHMKYPVLIGRDILKHGFLIDPNKKKVKK